MEITAASTQPAASTATAAPSRISSDFETFLRMLTTQMQNQDPLNPLEASDFAVQLATFSSVEQQVRTNDLLSGLGQQMSLMGLAQLSGWVGREARAAVPVAFTGTPVELFPDPPVIADSAELVVRNAAGTEVYRGPVPVDAQSIEWSGTTTTGAPAPAGTYSFSLDSYSYDEPIAQQPLESYARITEARTSEGQTVLVLQGGVQVAATDVTGLRQPA